MTNDILSYDDIFVNNGIMGLDNIAFSKRNLIIGENGSGKTRFLKSLIEYYRQKENDHYVISLFFPETLARLNASLDVPTNNDSDTLYDILFGNEKIDFQDFLRIIEHDRCGFIEDLFLDISHRARFRRGHAQKALDNLNSILNILINRNIEMNRDDKLIMISTYSNSGETIRSVGIYDMFNELSPGELMLFHFSVFMFYLNLKQVNNLVVIMDEPELHLHPQKLLYIMNHILNYEHIDSIWVASHSIYLIPLFSFEEIVYMKNGVIAKRNSHLYESIYDDLVGLDNIEIFEFLKSFKSWQCYKFILECFCLPEALKGNQAQLRNDEQYIKFSKKREEMFSAERVRVLDYGAGKFRLYQCIRENSILYPEIENRVIYNAFEPYPESDQFEEFDFFTTVDQIPQKSYDIVVLMNVLHEIDVSEWLSTFENIYNSLNDNGVLIMLEVTTLSKGEQPYGNTGFLVLQDRQVKVLFNDIHIDNYKATNEKSNCWVIDKESILSVSLKSIQKCIVSLRTESKSELRRLYDKKRNIALSEAETGTYHLQARNYAFFSQQYINAEIALDIMKGDKHDFSEEKPSLPTEKVKYPGLKNEE